MVSWANAQWTFTLLSYYISVVVIRYLVSPTVNVVYIVVYICTPGGYPGAWLGGLWLPHFPSTITEIKSALQKQRRAGHVAHPV